MNMRRSILCLAVLASITIDSAALGQVSYRKVMRSGEPAPDTTGIFDPQLLSYPSIDEAGRVSFSCYLKHGIGGVGALNQWTLYSEDSLGALHLVARQGDTTPGNINFHFDANSFTTQHKNPPGQVAFYGVGAGNLSAIAGIWAQNVGGAVVQVAVNGTPVSNPPGTEFDGVGTPSMNTSADIVFQGTLKQGVGGVNQFNDLGLWCRTAGGPLRLVAREGDVLPNTPPGVPPGSFSYGQSGFSFSNTPLINAGGQVAFYVYLNGVGPALMAESNTMVPPRVVAYAGQAAPGLGNVQFLNFTGFTFNNDGNTAFSATLTGNGVTTDNDESIWVEDGGALQLIAREGDAAPGGGHYWILYPPALSGGGEVAFCSFLKQGQDGVDFTNDFAIYKYTVPAGNIVLIMRDGMPAPGMPAGVTFNAPVFNPSINDAGQVVFYAGLTGAPVFQFNGDSVWATSLTGELTPIIVRGQSIEISPGDFRTVNTCGSYLVSNASAAQTGKTYQLNNNNQVCVTATLSDGTTAVYVATIDGGGACVAPNITGHPGNQSVCNGGSASFVVNATGTATLNYQWRRGVTNLNNGGNISGATTDTLTINPAGPGDVATDYNCFVSNACGNATCLNANLSLTAQSSINGHPANKTLIAGEAATFTVSVIGSGTPIYQWRKDGMPLSNGARIFGADTAGLTINPTNASDAGSYDVVAISPCAILTSNTAALTVNPAPVITLTIPTPPPGSVVVPPVVLPVPGAPACAAGGGTCGAGMTLVMPLLLTAIRRGKKRFVFKTSSISK
jgi:hypothetical protein